MARVLYFILLTTFIPFLIVAQQTNGNASVPVGASLIPTYNGTPWLSPSGDFAFGFKQIHQKDSFLLSIWYDKIPENTVVWYPKDGPMVPRGSKVELTNGRGLVPSDPQGEEIWTSGSNNSELAYGFMNDIGNFVIVDSISHKIWESFCFPTDTILPTQVMEREEEINSKISETNFTTGRFQLRFLKDGNIFLRKRDIPSGILYNVYYRSGTRDDSNMTNSGLQLTFDETGYMYILRRSGQIFELNQKDALPSKLYYQRATLLSDRGFTQYYYLKNPTSNTNWEVLWSLPNDRCKWIDENTEGSGACGLNSVCSLDGIRTNCECPHGFSLLDRNDPNGDSKPDFTQTCDKGYDRDRFGFIELTNIDWPESDYVRVQPTTEENCKTFCLQDCFPSCCNLQGPTMLEEEASTV
ncbi:putative non-specific serine/threonine protein kinase [Helianthus anomalus]